MNPEEVVKQCLSNWEDRKQRTKDDLEVVCKALEEFPDDGALADLKKDLEYQLAILCIYD